MLFNVGVCRAPDAAECRHLPFCYVYPGPLHLLSSLSELLGIESFLPPIHNWLVSGNFWCIQAGFYRSSAAPMHT